MAYQPDDYLIKPFTRETLEKKLQNLVERKELLRGVEKTIADGVEGIGADKVRHEEVGRGEGCVGAVPRCEQQGYGGPRLPGGGAEKNGEPRDDLCWVFDYNLVRGVIDNIMNNTYRDTRDRVQLMKN